MTCFSVWNSKKKFSLIVFFSEQKKIMFVFFCIWGGYHKSNCLKFAHLISSLLYNVDFIKLWLFSTSIPKNFLLGNYYYKNFPYSVLVHQCCIFLVWHRYTIWIPITDSWPHVKSFSCIILSLSTVIKCNSTPVFLAPAFESKLCVVRIKRIFTLCIYTCTFIFWRYISWKYNVVFCFHHW